MVEMVTDLREFDGASPPEVNAQWKCRAAPLWRVRVGHDGAPVTFPDVISRRRGEASQVTSHFQKLSPTDKEALFDFLRSL